MLKINNVRMPEPALNGLKISKEKIWSKNTGRVSSGEMVGDVVARKITLSIQWPRLTEEQVAIIDKAIDPAFVSVYFKNPNTNKYETRTFYAGTPTYPVYSYALGKYEGVAVDLVEK